jgi:hypothetical protein
MATNREKHLIISYLTMRRLIGVLGMMLPIVLVVGGLIQNKPVVLDSISDYYYTNMRDFFVGLLSGVSLFLISFKGYELIDDIVVTLGGIFAAGMIFFPTSLHADMVTRVGLFKINDNVSEYIHLMFGALFFLSLSFISTFLFTRRHPGVMGKEKRKRNIVYRTCGIVMTVSVFCIFIYNTFLVHTAIASIKPVLIFETIALFAFGISWFVKGHTLFKDK